MSGQSTITAIAETLGSALEPLELALRSPAAFQSFMVRLGWNTDVIIEPVQNLGVTASRILRLVENGLDAADAATVIGLLADFFTAVNSLSSAANLPTTIDAAEFRADFPQQLTGYLIADYLLSTRPLLGALLLAGGVITRTEQPEAGKRPHYVRLEVAWDAIGSLVHDSLATLRNAYGWGSPDFAALAFLDNMAALGDAMGYDVFYHTTPPHLKEILHAGATTTTELHAASLRWLVFGSAGAPAAIEFGVDFYVLPATPTLQPGIAISPYSKGISSTEFDLAETLSLVLKGELDVSKGVLVSIRPGQGVTLTSGLLGDRPSAAGEVSASFQARGEGGEKSLLLGTADGSRYEYAALSLTLGAASDLNGPRFYVEAAIVDGTIVISPGPEADGFIASLLPQSISADAGLTLGLDSRRGFYIGGSDRLEVEIPVGRSARPLEILSATFSLQGSGPSLPLALGATFRASAGPLTVDIGKLGLVVDLSFGGSGGNMGPVNAALRYKPPDGVGLSIDEAGVTGGGFLRFDPAAGQYAGAVELTLHDTIVVKGLGLIATRLPGAATGFSLLIAITAEGFQPIPLPLGFRLTGIGGLLALHRTFDENVLRSGLKNHTLDAVLFPNDPVRNAPALLANLDRVFPPAPGHHLFGPVARIEWGTPTIITADIALILELGARLRLLILAQLSAILPKPDQDLVRLQMDAVGVLDFDQGTAALDAVLLDSRLVKKFVLTGAMALRFNWRGSPNLALAVGGLHPAFNPPPKFPKLERIAINLAAGNNPRIRCEAYFALTANTVQFGARAELYAEAVGFSILGQIGFDVLVQLAPFQFLAEFFAQVQLKRGSTNLFKVRVEGALAGPRPLRIKAKATFEILWWDVTFRVDHTLVAGDPPPLPAPVDVLPLLLAALSTPANWVPRLPGGPRQLVTLRSRPDNPAEAQLHPLGALTVKQAVVPLNLDITRFGQAAPAGARRFDIRRVTLGGQDQPPTIARDFFAPAQFLELSDADKLSQPSFEQLPAGVDIVLGDLAFDPAASLLTPAIQFETKILGQDSPAGGPAPQPPPYTLGIAQLAQQARFGAAANSDLRRSGSAKYRSVVDKHRLVKEGWSLVAEDDLAVQAAAGTDGRPLSYAEAAQALGRQRGADAAKAAGLTILRFQSEVLAKE